MVEFLIAFDGDAEDRTAEAPGLSYFDDLYIDTSGQNLDSPLAGGVPGDTDGDGDVDLDDLFAVRNNFGATSGVTRADGDVAPHPAGNGTVDLDDLFMVRNNFGTGLAAVPEPMTLSLLGIGAMALLRRRSL